MNHAKVVFEGRKDFLVRLGTDHRKDTVAAGPAAQECGIASCPTEPEAHIANTPVPVPGAPEPKAEGKS